MDELGEALDPVGLDVRERDGVMTRLRRANEVAEPTSRALMRRRLGNLRREAPEGRVFRCSYKQRREAREPSGRHRQTGTPSEMGNRRREHPTPAHAPKEGLPR